MINTYLDDIAPLLISAGRASFVDEYDLKGFKASSALIISPRCFVSFLTAGLMWATRTTDARFKPHIFLLFLLLFIHSIVRESMGYTRYGYSSIVVTYYMCSL